MNTKELQHRCKNHPDFFPDECGCENIIPKEPKEEKTKYACCWEVEKNGGSCAHINNLLTEKKKEEFELEDKILMAIIYNELEDYDEKREPSRWKINLEKLKSFTAEILSQQAQEIREAIEKMRAEIFEMRYSPVKSKEELKMEVHEQTLRIGFNQAIDEVLKLLDKKE